MIDCKRCGIAMDFRGKKRISEWTDWWWFGMVEMFFEKKIKYDEFMCPCCGSVEFFVDGVGEELRDLSEPEAEPDSEQESEQGV